MGADGWVVNSLKRAKSKREESRKLRDERHPFLFQKLLFFFFQWQASNGLTSSPSSIGSRSFMNEMIRQKAEKAISWDCDL